MKHSNPLSIFILVRSLSVGGAERQVNILAKTLKERGYKVTVGLFYQGGVWEEDLHKAGISIHLLHKKGRWDIFGWLWRYIKAVQKINPDVIYSFLPPANIVAAIGKFFNRKPVVWGIRASNMNLKKYDWLASLAGWIEQKLSRYANLIIFNAHYSQRYYQSLGYCATHTIVIPNGIDTYFFKPALPVDKIKTRDDLKIPHCAFVIGMLARFDPMKDYETFLAAARNLCAQHQNMYFIAAGAGTDTAPWKDRPSHFLPLGIWQDMPALLGALNVMVLSSAFGEGFPNVVGEAMACGVPAIVTDVGDAATVVGNLGVVIPPKNPSALIQAIEAMQLLSPNPMELRDRILTNFSVTKMVDKTIQALTSVCGHS